MDKKFNMEAFIEKRLLEISDLNDRRETREILTEVFQMLYKHTEERFQGMEQEILSGIQKQELDYVIYTGISTPATFDITEGSMFPIVMSDLDKREINTKELLENLKSGIEVDAFTIFLEMEYRAIKNLVAEKRIFGGSVHTENGEYPIKACIRKADRYQKVIQELFQMVINNGIPWKTMGMMYINKFFDVVLLSADIPEDEYIIKVEIDFQEYTPYVKYHMFPTWNIEKINAVSEVKKIGTLGVVQYQHSFGKKYIRDDFYIIADSQHMLSRSDREEEIVVTTDYVEDSKWELYAIKKNAKQLSEYPVLGNKVEKGKVLAARTQGDIFQVVNSMGYQDRLKLKDVTFPQEYEPLYETYDMNDDIACECKSNRELQPMVLHFEKLKDDFLQMDVMSYLISGVQRSFPEYACYGEYCKAE